MRSASLALTLAALLLVLPRCSQARFGAPPPPRIGFRSSPGAQGAAPAPRALGLTSTALWPLPLSDSRSAACHWTLIASDSAAVSDDCPYTGHGPGGSLEACQAACVSAGGELCTDLNFSPSISDCVFRRCADPARPNLTATPGYSVWAVARPAVAHFGVAPGFAFALAPGSHSSAPLLAALARARSAAFSYGPPQPPALPGPTAAGLLVSVLTPDALLRLGVNESYALEVAPSGSAFQATLTAQTAIGAMRGLETFYQLLAFNQSDGTYCLEAAAIVDAPRFPHRGVMIDTSRHFMSLSVIKQVVDMMAAVKLNVLSLHLNDDQSWRACGVRSGVQCGGAQRAGASPPSFHSPPPPH